MSEAETALIVAAGGSPATPLLPRKDMFKNITVFRYPPSSDFEVEFQLEIDAAEYELRPLGPLEIENAGFVKLRDGLFAPGAGGAVEIRVGFQAKMLPPSVVNEAVAAKAKKIAQDEGRKVSARERKRLREDVFNELLPRAFVRRKDIQAVFDPMTRRLLIDTSSQGKAEDVVSQIRSALGSFPALPQSPEESPALLLTGWLSDPSRLPARLALGDEVVLYDRAEPNGRVWRGRRTDLNAEDVAEHLRSGLAVKQLGLVYDERLSFVLGDDLVLRKFRMLDEALDSLGEFENQDDEHQANLFLFTEETRALLDYLDEIFDVRTPE